MAAMLEAAYFVVATTCGDGAIAWRGVQLGFVRTRRSAVDPTQRLIANTQEVLMSVEHEPLPYSPDALEPYIDRQTMEIHHGKHYAAYVSKYNEAVQGSEFDSKPLEQVLSDLNALPEKIRTAVRNNGGGAFNHALFWRILAGPNNGGGGEPSGALADAIARDFGSFAAFKEQFENAAKGQFGSGWAWLALRGGKLEVTGTPNQDSPLMTGAKPILGLDVWEHAYYLKYQNRRPDYVSAWWNVVNWAAANQIFEQASK